MREITGRLENWKRTQASEEEFVIFGDLHKDTRQRWHEGFYIHTSGILNRSVKEGDIVETRNSTYLLGKPLTKNK